MPRAESKPKRRRPGTRRDRDMLRLAVARLRHHPVDETCEGLGISRATYYRLIEELDEIKEQAVRDSR